MYIIVKRLEAARFSGAKKEVFAPMGLVVTLRAYFQAKMKSFFMFFFFFYEN